MLLILAGVSLSAIFSERGIFSRAEKAGDRYNEAKAKEILETVLMADAQTEKYTNSKYNQDDFLDELIKKEIEGSEIRGDVVIIDGWAFELDRSVPKIGKDLGQADKLVFPTVTVSEAQLASDSRTSTFTVTALEETNGINKIEIWLNGEKLDTYDKTYTNIKTEISEDFTVNRNGTYIVKVYGKLMASATVEVSGIVPVVKFSPNGSTEWKKEHSTTITVEQTGETVTEIKYLWKTGENEPQASEFTETCTNNSTITGKELTGEYHLWVLLKTDNDKTNICGSEEFYFDNQGPNITAFTPTKYSVDGITLSATAQDIGLGTIRFEFYVDEELKDTQTCDVTKESVTKTSIPITGLTTGNHNCKVIVYDAEENSSTRTASGATKLYTWERWGVIETTIRVPADSYVHMYYDCRFCFPDYNLVNYGCISKYEPKWNSTKQNWNYIIDAQVRTYNYFTLFSCLNSNVIYKRAAMENNNICSYYMYRFDNCTNGYANVSVRKVTNKTNYSKGTTQYSDVTSTSSSAYPNGAASGSYWYVYKGAQ